MAREEDGYEYNNGEAMMCYVETPNAIKVKPVKEKDERKGFWVPKNVIHDDSEVYKKGTDGKLVVKESWAEREGWD